MKKIWIFAIILTSVILLFYGIVTLSNILSDIRAIEFCEHKGYNRSTDNYVDNKIEGIIHVECDNIRFNDLKLKRVCFEFDKWNNYIKYKMLFREIEESKR